MLDYIQVHSNILYQKTKNEKCFFFFLEVSFKDSGKQWKFTTLELLDQKHYLSPLTPTHTHARTCTYVAWAKPAPRKVSQAGEWGR